MSSVVINFVIYYKLQFRRLNNQSNYTLWNDILLNAAKQNNYIHKNDTQQFDNRQNDTRWNDNL